MCAHGSCEVGSLFSWNPDNFHQGQAALEVGSGLGFIKLVQVKKIRNNVFLYFHVYTGLNQNCLMSEQ